MSNEDIAMLDEGGVVNPALALADPRYIVDPIRPRRVRLSIA